MYQKKKIIHFFTLTAIVANIVFTIEIAKIKLEGLGFLAPSEIRVAHIQLALFP